MKIVIYQDRNLNEERIQNSLRIIYESLKKKFKDHEIVYIKYSEFRLVKCDYAIMWNVYCRFKENTSYRKKIKDFQKKNNNKLIIVELGFIDRKNYYSFGFDHISNFGSYPKFPDNDDRLKKLNLNLQELNYNDDPKKHILFCGQLPWDTQVQDINYTKWVIKTLNEIRKYSDRKIIFRKHPKHKVRPGFIYYDKKFLKKNKIHAEISSNNLNDDLKNCYCVIAYNSTVLIDAILNGVPTISGSKTSIVYNITNKNINDINNLKKITFDEVKKELFTISYKQWTLEEFKDGLPFKYFFKN